jgi:hypothetical protein
MALTWICLQTCILSWNIVPSLSEYTSLITKQSVRCLRWRYNRVRLYVTVAGSKRMITDSLMPSTVQRCAVKVCFHRQRLSHVHGSLLRGFLCTILSSDVYCLFLNYKVLSTLCLSFLLLISRRGTQDSSVSVVTNYGLVCWGIFCTAPKPVFAPNPARTEFLQGAFSSGLKRPECEPSH